MRLTPQSLTADRLTCDHIRKARYAAQKAAA